MLNEDFEKMYKGNLILRTEKESEVNMPEFEHNRRERLEAVVKEITSSKESARKFLQETGIMDATGNLALMYR